MSNGTLLNCAIMCGFSMIFTTNVAIAQTNLGLKTAGRQHTYPAIEEFERADFKFLGTVVDIDPVHHPSSIHGVCGWSIVLEAQSPDSTITRVVLQDSGASANDRPTQVGDPVVVAGFYSGSPSVESSRSYFRERDIVSCNTVVYEAGEDLATYVLPLVTLDEVVRPVSSIPYYKMSREIGEYVVGWRNHQSILVLCTEPSICRDEMKNVENGVYNQPEYYVDVISLLFGDGTVP